MKTPAVVLLLIMANCSWPPFPAAAEKLVNCGGQGEWTNAVPGMTIPKQLNSVFVTADALYAVGEGGLVLTLVFGSPPTPPCYIGTGSLKSVLVDVKQNTMFIAGDSGIFEESLQNPCGNATPKVEHTCYALSRYEDRLFAGCDGDIQTKLLSGSTWTSSFSNPGRYYSVVAGSDKVFVGAIAGQAYRASVMGMNWLAFTEPAFHSQTLLGGWYDGAANYYMVGQAGVFARLEPGNDSWTDNRGNLSTTSQMVNWNSIWGYSSDINNVLYMVGYYTDSLPPNLPQGTILRQVEQPGFLFADPNHRYFGVHGNNHGVFVVGAVDAGLDAKGVILCQRRDSQ